MSAGDGDEATLAQLTARGLGVSWDPPRFCATGVSHLPRLGLLEGRLMVLGCSVA